MPKSIVPTLDQTPEAAQHENYKQRLRALREPTLPSIPELQEIQDAAHEVTDKEKPSEVSAEEWQAAQGFTQELDSCTTIEAAVQATDTFFNGGIGEKLINLFLALLTLVQALLSDEPQMTPNFGA